MRQTLGKQRAGWVRCHLRQGPAVPAEPPGDQPPRLPSLQGFRSLPSAHTVCRTCRRLLPNRPWKSWRAATGQIQTVIIPAAPARSSAGGSSPLSAQFSLHGSARLSLRAPGFPYESHRSSSPRPGMRVPGGPGAPAMVALGWPKRGKACVWGPATVPEATRSAVGGGAGAQLDVVITS